MLTPSKQAFWACLLVALCLGSPNLSLGQNIQEFSSSGSTFQIRSMTKINPTTVEVLFTNDRRMTLDFYADHIFRLFQDNGGGILREPKATPPARILLDNPRKTLSSLDISDTQKAITVQTSSIRIEISRENALLTVTNLKTGKMALQWTEPAHFDQDRVTLILKGQSDEYFFGGGVQNGRFSHKGKIISIENQNSWTDGGVASPTPFYWSTASYGFMWHTFKKGRYDFGSGKQDEIKLYHESGYLDVFFMINEGAAPLLNDFYQLTGNPILMPKFGFYQGHLNAYNRDFWTENKEGILFEDGKRYKESQKDNGGIKESLNGEKNNYQFSARAVIDRYKKQDMPLGWILPNDGYGAGYGQTETLDGNIQNLKEFGDYARQSGVEIGLWTQSDLHPKEGISALLQRDIIKEVRDAGVRVLKTDVAWVGPGYSFGLNGINDVSQVMSQYGDHARPFIISLDGWAGTQRYAGIWSGDQTGGQWEYIRFHIPTYLGSGLSGQPNITSDMDGIFGGKNVPVNVRDFQWKTFTPMQLNMDGWGSNEKYPHALGEPATSINRNYLKLKSILMPYAYSIAHEAVDSLPMIRAIFLTEPNAYTYGRSTQYQFMYGPSFLVAPIYQDTQMDGEGNDVRHGIYLPKGDWIDYFSGQLYTGNRILNSFEAPLWKLPVFVKSGAIIPITHANNNIKEINRHHRSYEIYPAGHSDFTEYDDDGVTLAYLQGHGATTRIESAVDGDRATITVHPTKGSYAGMELQKTTSFVINLTKKPKKLSARIGNKKQRLREVDSPDELSRETNTYYYDATPDLNRFSTRGTRFADVKIYKTPQLYVHVGQTDITRHSVQLDIQGYTFQPTSTLLTKTGSLSPLSGVRVNEADRQAYTLRPTWDPAANADYYEIEFEGQLYSTIRDTTLFFDNLHALTDYTFKIRAVNSDGTSDWSSIQTSTRSNPLEFAIAGISGETTVPNQGGNGIDKLFDYDEGNMWHTKWGQKAVPFDMILDLKSFNQLDKLQYLPRTDGGNGVLTRGKIYFSDDKENWTEAGHFAWKRNGDTKTFTFEDRPTARYIKLSIEEGAGGFGSGRELYVFKVPGSESYLPGDINDDGVLDMNDLTSYTNYTGLRQGDSDFEGYISKGDINRNGLIDVYDISVLTTQLDGGVVIGPKEKVAGKITLVPSSTQLKAGESVEITVQGIGLNDVNGLSFALPYTTSDYEFESIRSLESKQMKNLSNDRLHTNGSKALYVTYINIGEQETLLGDRDILVIKLKAKRALKFGLVAKDGMLVGKKLDTIRF